MNMEMLIEELQDIADNAFTIPLSGGKTVVNAERLKDIIDEMKENIPQEIKQAKNMKMITMKKALIIQVK